MKLTIVVKPWEESSGRSHGTPAKSNRWPQWSPNGHWLSFDVSRRVSCEMRSLLQKKHYGKICVSIGMSILICVVSRGDQIAWNFTSLHPKERAVTLGHLVSLLPSSVNDHQLVK